MAAPSPFRVKICGITREEDALAAVAAGADALGFVFAESSPRRVAPETARRLAALLPPTVAAIGVFASAGAERIRAIAREANCRVAQVHGEEAARELLRDADPSLLVIPAVRLASASDARALPGRFPGAAALLCDSAAPAESGREGGTGVAFPWEWLAGVALDLPLVLAGGLTPENVALAIRAVRPAAVDVSTGVEAAPGVKDERRVAAFVAAARAAFALL